MLLTGVVVGALRALWPWQSDERALLAPDEQLPLAIAMAVLGATVVLGMFRLGRRVEEPQPRPITAGDG